MIGKPHPPVTRREDCRCICHASATAIVLVHGPACCPEPRWSEHERRRKARG